MKRINSVLQLSFDFAAKLAHDYIKEILKFILIGGAGLLFALLAEVNIIFALLTLFITISAFCYSFWKGYVVTYALNYSAFDYYLKKPLLPFEEYIKLAQKDENKLAGFVGFLAVVTIIGYVPAFIGFIKNIQLEQIMLDPSNITVSRQVIVYSIIITLVLAQFINFALQAFFFDKKENYFSLFIKCYTNTGLKGFIVSNIIIAFVGLLNFKAPIIYLITFLPLNLIIYSINLFCYFEGMKKN